MFAITAPLAGLGEPGAHSMWMWCRLFVIACCAWLSGLPAPVAAAEREYLLRWIAAPGPETAFRVFLGAQPRAYTQTLDLGMVPPDSDGISRRTLELDADLGHYVAMTAYTAQGESPLSNEIYVEPLEAAGPTPDPVSRARVIAPAVHLLLRRAR